MNENCYDYGEDIERFMRDDPLDCTAPTGPRGKLSLPTAGKDCLPVDNPDSKLTTDMLWAAIDAAYAAAENQPVPDGWCTAQDYAMRAGISRDAALKRLSALVTGGKLQSGIYTAQIGGIRRKVRAWGLP